MCADVDFRIILSAGMSKAKEAGTPGDLDRREWYFENDELSDDELRASHAHEYGREIAKRSRYVLTQLKILWLANELPKKHQQRGPDLSGASIFHPTLPKKIKRHPDRVRGDEAKFKLWLFGIPVDTLGSRGSEKQSWYNFPENVRRDAILTALRRQREATLPSVFLRTSRELQPSGSAQPDDSLRSLIRFLRELDSTNLRGAEFGFFAIDWSRGLPALKKEIFDWLKQRYEDRRNLGFVPKRRPSRGQLRDQLRWLGALRFKEHYGHKNLTEENFQRITLRGPYQNMNDLYQAASKATKILKDRISDIERTEN